MASTWTALGTGDEDEDHEVGSPAASHVRNEATNAASSKGAFRMGLALLGVFAVAGVWRRSPPDLPPRGRAPRMAVSLGATEGASCAEPFMDCRHSRCCKTPGHTCYEKNEYYATCMPECVRGVKKEDKDRKPWSCKALGNRTEFPAGCAWPGQACSAGDATCCSQGFRCVRKDDAWSACQQVEVGPWTNGVPAKRVPIPGGWKGDVLGGWRSERKANAVAGPWDPEAKTTLFCFYAVLPGSAEEALVTLARDRKASIFGCEEHAIYHSTKSQTHRWGATGVATLVNTAAFVKVWDQVREDGLYLKTAWTVKVDADAIFFPARLRSHLDDLGAPANTPVYVKNTLPRFTLGGFLGAIEVLSRDAVSTFMDNSASCSKFIGMLSGEDGFLKDCADSLGVGYLHDEVLLHPSDNPIECQVEEFVAYHPLKSPNDWLYCYDIAAGNNANPPVLIQGLVDLLPPTLQAKYTKKAKAVEEAQARAAANAAAMAKKAELQKSVVVVRKLS